MSVAADASAPPPWPTELRLLRSAGLLRVMFEDGRCVELSADQLRRSSPSASERGHGGQPRRKPAAESSSPVQIVDLHPVGRYAVRIVFSDGHDTGLYTWPLLSALGEAAAQS